MISGTAVSLEQALKDRVLVMNSSPRNPAWYHLTPSDWGGEQFAFSPNLNISRPDLVLDWSIELLDAGADILETESFGADPFMAEWGFGADLSLARAWNLAAVDIARQAVAGARQAYIVGTVGTAPEIIWTKSRHTIEEHIEAFAEQVRDLWAAGVDAIHLTFQIASENVRAALQAVSLVEHELGCRIPTMITFDMNHNGTLVSGERPEALWDMIRPHRPIALALATYGYGQETVRRLRDVTNLPIGLLIDPWPREHHGPYRPIEWAAECLEPLLQERALSFCGLSCTVPSIDYVKAVAGLIQRA